MVKVFVPPDGACYECTMTENDYRLINLRYSCPLLRQEDLQAGKVPTAPTISSMIGGLQAQEALKLIHNLPVLAGEALIYNGVASQFYRTRFQRRDDCMSHETYAEPRELPLQTASTSAAQLLTAACDAAGMQRATSRLVLDRDLVVSIDCIPCGTSRPVMKTLTQVGVSPGHIVPSAGRSLARTSRMWWKPIPTWPIPGCVNWESRPTTWCASSPPRKRVSSCWRVTGAR